MSFESMQYAYDVMACTRPHKPKKFIYMTTKTFRAKLLEVQDNLLNFAYLLTSNRDDAYDLLQDTTLKVLDNEDKDVDNVNFKGWVFTIMRNTFINSYRKSVRANTIIDRTDDLFHLSLSQDSGFETPEGALATQEINALLAAFSDELRIPFSLHLAGYKYSEIADRTGIPLGTIKSRIFFARKRLQTALRDYR